MNASGDEGSFQREFINSKIRYQNKKYVAARAAAASKEVLVCRACFTDIGIRRMSDNILALYCKVTNTTRQIDESPCFPICICSTCLMLLRKFHRFQYHCQRSYVYLQKLAFKGNLDTKNVTGFRTTNFFIHSLNLQKSTTQIIDSTTKAEISWPTTPMKDNPSLVNNQMFQPYIENPNMNVLFHKQINFIQPVTDIQNGRKDNLILNSQKHAEGIQTHSGLDKPQVFVASCAKGKRTLTVEKGNGNTNNKPIAYNNAIPATATRSNIFQKQPTAIVINNGVIENLPAGLNINKGIFLNPPPLAPLSAVDSEIFPSQANVLMDPIEVYKDGSLQLTYDAAKAILEATNTACNVQNSDLKGVYATVPATDNLAESIKPNSGYKNSILYAMLNDNAKNPNFPNPKNDENITDSINMVTAIKTETVVDEEQGHSDSDEPNVNIGEVSEIKSELDDIVKEEHLIHPVEDYEKIIDEENTSQKDQTQNHQQEHSQVDDKVVEIDDSSSSSSDSSSTSSTSSSSSSSSDSDSDVEAVDLTLEDDEAVVVNAKETETLTNSVNEIDSLNKDNDTGQDAHFDDTNAADTDEILIKKSLLELNIDETKVVVENTSSEDTILAAKKICIKSETSSVEIHTRIDDDTDKFDKDTTNTIIKTTEIVENADKTDAAIVIANIATHKTEVIENMGENVEILAENLDSTVRNVGVGTIVEKVATTAITDNGAIKDMTIMANTLDIDLKDKHAVFQETSTRQVVDTIVNETSKNGKIDVHNMAATDVDNKTISVETVVTDAALNIEKLDRVENATSNIKTVEVVDSAKIDEATNKSVETTTKSVEGASNVGKTGKIVETPNSEPKRPSYYDSSSSDSGDLPDCLIGFSSNVFKADTKRNFTGPENGVEAKKQKVRYVDESERKKEKDEKKKNKKRKSDTSNTEYEHISVTNKKHRMVLRKRVNNMVLYPKRDSKWRRERDKLRERIANRK